MTPRTAALPTLALLTALSPPVAARASEWPQWRGPDQDGAARNAEVFSSPFELELAWSRPLGAGYSGISVAGGRVVTMFSDGTIDYLGAFELATGEPAWRVEIGPAYKGRHGSEDGPSSTPAIADGRVFAVGPRGRLVAVDLDSGELQWDVDLVESHGLQVPWYGFGSSPVPAKHLVYVSGFTRDARNGLAFAADDGRLLWSVEGSWMAYQSAIADRESGGLLVVAGTDLKLVDAADGSELFRYAYTDDADLTHPQLVPVGTDRILLTGEHHSELYRLDRQADPPLHLLWRSRDLSGFYVPPVVHEGTIFGLSGIFLVAVDAGTGERRWKSREPGARNLILVDDQLVIFASNGDVVVARAGAERYSETARIRAADRGGYTPASLAGSRILVRNTSRLSCIEVTAAEPQIAAADEDHLPPPGPFRDFVVRLQGSDDPGALLDAWWSERDSLPLVENDSVVHFVYRGPAREVGILGDMTAELYLPEPMWRLKDTDLFYRSYEYEPQGLWSYSFLVDLDRVVADPCNPMRTPSVAHQNPVSVGYDPPEEHSVVAMPAWKRPDFLAAASGGGRLETLPFLSEKAYRKYDLSIYLPAGYDEDDRSYPVLYVLGSAPWLEHARLANAFDNLMGPTVEPAIAVLVPYRKGSWDRMGFGSYANLLADEIAPLVERSYRTRGPGVILASGDDGAAAVAAGLKAPAKFARLALHSPRAKPDEIEKLSAATEGPTRAYLEWSRFEPRIPDENLDFRILAQELVSLLRGVGTTVESAEVAAGAGWLSWSSRLDRSLAAVLPPAPPSQRAAR